MDRSSFIEDHAYLVRFAVLFAVWGVVGYEYKLFMDLTIRGQVLSGLFFSASILVALGVKTRCSMLVLGATMLVHGLMSYHRNSLLCGTVAAVSALLPLGAFYSFDRLRLVGAPELPYQPLSDPVRPTPLAVGLFGTLLAVIVAGPAFNQIFHGNIRIFRNWEMFSAIGKGVVVAEFTSVAGGRRVPVDYLALLGHKVRHVGVHRNKAFIEDYRIIGPEQLASVVARVCRASPDAPSLRLNARIATLKHGWQTLYDGSEPLCAAGPAR